MAWRCVFSVPSQFKFFLSVALIFASIPAAILAQNPDQRLQCNLALVQMGKTQTLGAAIDHFEEVAQHLPEELQKELFQALLDHSENLPLTPSAAENARLAELKQKYSKWLPQNRHRAAAEFAHNILLENLEAAKKKLDLAEAEYNYVLALVNESSERISHKKAEEVESIKKKYGNSRFTRVAYYLGFFRRPENRRTFDDEWIDDLSDQPENVRKIEQFLEIEDRVGIPLSKVDAQKLLALKKSDITRWSESSEGKAYTAAIDSIAANDYPRLKEILKSGDLNSNSADFLGITPLMLAASHGETEAVKILVDRNSWKEGNYLPPRVNSSQRTALVFAAYGGHRDCLQPIIDAEGLSSRDLLDVYKAWGQNVTIQGEGFSPALLAKTFDASTFELLLENAQRRKVDLTELSKLAVRSLLEAEADQKMVSDKARAETTYTSMEQVLRMIDGAGGNMDVVMNEKGETGLMRAAQFSLKTYRSIDLLLELGANKKIKDNEGHTAYWHFRQRVKRPPHKITGEDRTYLRRLWTIGQMPPPI